MKLEASRHEPAEPADRSTDLPQGLEKLTTVVDLGAWNPHRDNKSQTCVKLRFLEYSTKFLDMWISHEDAAQLWYTLHDQRNEFRPRTGQLIVNMLQQMQGQVMSGCVTRMLGKVYIANLEVAMPASTGASQKTILNIDCRPSDCINICMRAGVPMYVSRAVAEEMAQSTNPEPRTAKAPQRSWFKDSHIRETCRAEEKHHCDPLIHMQLQLQLHIKNEQYDMAQCLRSKMFESMLGWNSKDSAGRQTVYTVLLAMRAALDDDRLEEAAVLRDQLYTLRTGRQAPPETWTQVLD
ncbi:hypothetical protein WJX74_010848 [Apatococcus lobatus]|uniref:BFN domain-containing protein n=2 Tax=Apatococcus TaxID=904362 RepID=A0AAW1SPB2_9CHLO